MSAPLPGRPTTAAVVDDWACLRQTMDMFRDHITGWDDQLGMQYSRVAANICNARAGREALIAACHGTSVLV